MGFGIGSIIGKAVGGILSSVGLGKVGDVIGKVVSGVANAMTGNWLGVAQDVAGLVARFAPKDSALGKFANFASKAPLGGFGSGNGSGLLGGLGKLFGGGRIGNIMKSFTSGFDGVKSMLGGDFSGATKIFDAFKQVKSFVDDSKDVINQTRALING